MKSVVNGSLNELQRQIYSSVERIKKHSGDQWKGLENIPDGNAFQEKGLKSYAYKLLSSSISYQLTNMFSADSDLYTSDYAAGSYEQASVVNKEPTILIDFVFKNNREFDIKA